MNRFPDPYDFRQIRLVKPHNAQRSAIIRNNSFLEIFPRFGENISHRGHLAFYCHRLPHLDGGNGGSERIIFIPKRRIVEKVENCPYSQDSQFLGHGRSNTWYILDWGFEGNRHTTLLRQPARKQWQEGRGNKRDRGD